MTFSTKFDTIYRVRKILNCYSFYINLAKGADILNSYEQKSKMFTTITVVLVTLVIAFLANWFQYSAGQAVLNSTMREMEEIVAQLELSLEKTIDERETDLSLIAQSMSAQNITKDNALEYFESQSHAQKFPNLFYIDLDGSGISNNGSELEFNNCNSYLGAFSNDFVVSKCVSSTAPSEYVFKLAVPIAKNGETVAVLLSEESFEHFYQDVMTTTNGYGVTFIVNYDLEVIFTSDHSYLDGNNVSTQDLKYLGYDNINVALENAQAGNSGGFSYTHEGIPKLLVYAPIDKTEWSLAVSIEQRVINDELSVAVEQLQYICQAIYWFLIILIVYIWFSQSRSVKKLEKTAFYDQLTELPNMVKLKKDIQSTLIKNPTKNYTVLKFDIVNFKIINELFGFEVGNKILKVAKLVGDSANEPSLIVARVGVDEYIAFAETKFLADVEKRTSIYEQFYQKTVPEIGNYNILFRYGRYNIENSETDVSDIINKVTLAHSMSKTGKTSEVYDYDEDYKNKLISDVSISNKMNFALKNNEYKVFLQPKFSVDNEKIIGAEALVRWFESDGNIVYPNEFIPLFEKNGFIIELDKHILEQTCILMQDWMDRGISYLPISINCSRLTIHAPDFLSELVRIVDKYNIPHHLIEIELTESTAIESEHLIRALFKQMHDLGFKISIDDFGSGYSSLSLLKNLKVDILKMDRSFFSNTDNSHERSDMLIDGIVKLSHNLNLYVVAEGIETTEQIEFLKSINCDAIQGYYYAKPMSISDFEEKYADIMPKTL